MVIGAVPLDTLQMSKALFARNSPIKAGQSKMHLKRRSQIFRPPTSRKGAYLLRVLSESDQNAEEGAGFANPNIDSKYRPKPRTVHLHHRRRQRPRPSRSPSPHPVLVQSLCPTKRMFLYLMKTDMYVGIMDVQERSPWLFKS